MNLTATQRGMAYMLLSTLAFMAMNAITRYLASQIHPFEISFFRSLFGLAYFVPLLLRRGWWPGRRDWRAPACACQTWLAHR